MGKCSSEPACGRREESPGYWIWKGKWGILGKPVAHPQDPGLTPEPGLNMLGCGWPFLRWQTGCSSQRAVESKWMPHMEGVHRSLSCVRGLQNCLLTALTLEPCLCVTVSLWGLLCVYVHGVSMITGCPQTPVWPLGRCGWIPRGYSLPLGKVVAKCPSVL